MSTPFIGEIRLVAFRFAPEGWASCDGQVLPIAQNQVLFAILGTTYGGDGRTTFALPDLRGRVALHASPAFLAGAQGGQEAHALTLAEMPSHTHTAAADANPASQASPLGQAWANGGEPAYAAAPDASMATEAVAPAGAGQAHENRQPFLVLTAIIALQGIFPARS